MSRWSRWLLRGTLVTLLLAVYVGIWGNTARRAFIESVAVPVLTTVQATSPSTHAIDGRPAARTLLIETSTGAPTARQDAPAGVRFLLPALFLIALAPTRRYWLWLWGAHLALALVGLGLLSIGIAIHDIGFNLHRLLTAYLVDAVSLGIATLAVVREFPRPE